MPREKHRGITRYSVFNADTVRNLISPLPLPCMAQRNVIIMVSRVISRLLYRETSLPFRERGFKLPVFLGRRNRLSV